jgi:hypothetical protein
MVTKSNETDDRPMKISREWTVVVYVWLLCYVAMKRNNDAPPLIAVEVSCSVKVPFRVCWGLCLFNVVVDSFINRREEDCPKGWSTVLVTAMGSWEKRVPRGHVDQSGDATCHFFEENADLQPRGALDTHSRGGEFVGWWSDLWLVGGLVIWFVIGRWAGDLICDWSVKPWNFLKKMLTFSQEEL